ncbi:MAG: cytochrome-c peroxidase [Planctomycetia bacterium]
MNQRLCGLLAAVLTAAAAWTIIAAGEGRPTAAALPTRSSSERTAWAATLRRLYQRSPREWPAPHVDLGVEWREISRLPLVHHPTSNPHSVAKEKLGRTLFFDPRLSRSGQMACTSCHDPDLAWTDGRRVSFGHALTPLARNAPSINNVAFQSTLSWDGQAASIEEQTARVLLTPQEMHVDCDDIVASLERSEGYRERFEAAFGDDALSFDRIVQALACFQRTIIGGDSRFDRFVEGDHTALTDAEVIGLDLFRREARCMNCHHGPLFSDGRFHDLGLSYYGRRLEDLGRFNVTGDPADVGRFRTPSLRDVTRTGPLMHNGLFELPGVLAMYNAGMVTLKRQVYQRNDPLFPSKSPHLRPLGLSRQDLSDLEAFLGALAEGRHRVEPPAAAVP